MQKWEYLSYSTYLAYLYFEPGSVVDLPALLQEYKQDIKKKIHSDEWMDQYELKDKSFVGSRIPNLLGAIGWEAYARTERTWYFKRPIP